MAHIRQSKPDYGLGLQVRVLQHSRGVPSSLRGKAHLRGGFPGGLAVVFEEVAGPVLEFRVEDLGFSFLGLDLRIEGLGFRI